MDIDTLKKYLKSGLEIFKLNQTEIEKVAKDPQAFNYAFVIVALYGIAIAIGSLNLPGIILMPISTIIGSIISIGILHVLAMLLGGKGTFSAFYGTMGVAYAPFLVAVIPVVGPMIAGFLGLWMIVVAVNIIKQVHQITTGKAVVVVLIPLVIGLIIGALFAAMIGAAVLGGLAQLPA